MRAVLLVLVLLFPVTLAGATCAWITLAPPWATGDPLYEELSAVNASHAQEWDAIRPASADPSWPAARAAWQMRYAQEVRQVYLRHGRTPPSWVNRSDGRSR